MVVGSEIQQNCEFDLKKSFPFRGKQNIELKIQTPFKQELNDLKSYLSEYMKSEITRQKNEQSELTNLFRKELADLKVYLESFIKSELTTQQKKNKDEFKNEMETVCGRKLAGENRKLTEDIANKFSKQEEAQRKLIQVAFTAIEPPHVDSDRWDSNFDCLQYCGPVMDLPNDCVEAMPSIYHKGGVYLMNGTETGLKPYYGYCKRINDKAWTIVQRRENGAVDFYRNWTDYKLGFGDLYGEFWLGLERLHALTSKHKHELRIWLASHGGSTAYAHYDQILIGSEAEKYKLTVTGYSGTAGNAFRDGFNEIGFSTKDNRNDKTGAGFKACTETYKGAWWFSNCYLSHLNGPYFAPVSGVDWNPWVTRLKYSEMAIRRVGN